MIGSKAQNMRRATAIPRQKGQLLNDRVSLNVRRRHPAACKPSLLNNYPPHLHERINSATPTHHQDMMSYWQASQLHMGASTGLLR